MNNKNLIIFSYDYPPLDGGIARLCNEIACGALDYYEKVTVLTTKKEGQKKSYSTADNVTIVEVRSKRICCEWDCYKYLCSIKNKQDYDVVCGLWHPEASIALFSGFKNVYTLAHGTELLAGTSKFKRNFWLPIYAKFVLNKTKSVITNSHYTERLAKKINPKANTIAIPLAVNHLFFKPEAAKKENNDIISLCSVSRVQQFKGHDFIIKTIAALPSDLRAKIRYNIAGRGSYLPELKNLAKQLNVENIVSFKGFVADSDLPAFYSQNDVFILCTRESTDSTNVEGFGLVFLEAQSCGIPAIGTNTGGIPDAVHNENGGWLIEQDNKEELSALLTKLIESPLLIKEMGVKARERVESCSTWQIYCEKLFDVIKQ